MTKRRAPEIHIAQFIVTGTNNLFTANKAIQKLLNSDRCQLQEARYWIDGKTITIKPRTVKNLA